MNVEDIAKVCHEVNRAYCEAIGDVSQLAWEEAPGWQRKSAINSVRAHLADDRMAPNASHDLWMAEKMNNGWTWGPEKNVEKKQHPCILAYHELPAEQRAKDYIFGAVVRTIRSVEGEKLGDGVVGDHRLEGNEITVMQR